MIFKYLKFLQPVHYFSSLINAKYTVFPNIESSDKEFLLNLEVDPRYHSKAAQEYDLSWRAINGGYIGNCKTYSKFKNLPVVDEYIFLRKNFHSAWVTYVLCLRLLQLSNPFKEITAYFKTLHIAQEKLVATCLKNVDYTNFKSELLNSNPLVSVIIPTLNRYSYLKEVLRDLENQLYKNFEVLIVDQTECYKPEIYEDWNLNIIVWRQKEKALWMARNTAIKKAKGKYILLFDDDSRVDQNWICEHLKALDFFHADISSGVSLNSESDKIPDRYSFFRVSDQLDTGNVLLTKDIFKRIGLFDEQFEGQRMGDGEFGLRAFQSGLINISNPQAKRIHLKAKGGGLRQMGSWDSFRPSNFFAPRPIPSVVYFYRSYFGRKQTLYALLKNIPTSIIPYKFKSSKLLLVMGIIISILISPIILLQVFRSWYLASKKIKEGPKIKKLIEKV